MTNQSQNKPLTPPYYPPSSPPLIYPPLNPRNPPYPRVTISNKEGYGVTRKDEYEKT